VSHPPPARPDRYIITSVGPPINGAPGGGQGDRS